MVYESRMGLRIGRYLRVSRKEQSKTLERQLFSLEQTVLKLGGDLEESPLFVDVQSGRESDRVEFLKMVRAIETHSLDILIAYRVDRLARDLEVSARLYKLFERGAARLYDFQREDFVDFSNPEEWESYAQRGVSAEAESRKLSKRIRSGYEFSRHKGKAGSKPPWGYIRNPETEKYELDPNLAEAVRDSIKILLSKGNFQESCRIIAERWGKQWQPNSLRVWICNPVLRGHTGYSHQGRHWGEIKFSTHPEHAVLTEQEYQQIESLIEERRQYWGANGRATRHPLGGLVVCGRCGTKMCVTLGHTTPTGRKNLYFSCRDRVHRVKPDICTMRRSLRVDIAEDLVIDKLIQARETIATLGQTPTQPAKSPELLRLENLLVGLNRLGDDPSLWGSKDQIRAQIAQIRASEGSVDQTIAESRELLLSVFGSRAEWEVLKLDEKRHLFRALVDRVVVDVTETDTGEVSKRGNPKQIVNWQIDVILKPLGLPSSPHPEETVHPPSDS